MDSPNIVGALRAFGAVDDEVLTFDGALGPQHIDQLDLHPDGCHGGRPLRVDATVCPNNRVLLYVVRGRYTPEAQDALASDFAQRGEGEFVGFLEPGVLTVVPTAHNQRNQRAEHKASTPAARGVIPGLTFGTSDLKVKGADQVLHQGLLKLFNESVRSLAREEVTPEDALSLVGRAMFFRFLIDRGFVREAEAPLVAGGALTLTRAMATASSVRASLRWLDHTFNGHLLPLSEDALAHVTSPQAGSTIREQLTHILTRRDAHGQRSFSWAELDFAHLPIGLLSEVYEHWAHTYDGERAQREGAWYTPASIAQNMVREALDAVPAPWDARVLDPACGAGVFLAAAFRKLVQATWEHTGRRPGRETVRRILTRQLTGLEVNEAALRLSALSLYLTALELDPEPGPSARVPFPDLIEEKVLRDVRAEADRARIRAELPPVGSLGAHVDRSLEGSFQVVVGNPPWTPWAATTKETKEAKETKEEKEAKAKALKEALREVASVVGPIVRERLGTDDGYRYEMTKGNPDLPFVWRAAQWAVPDGVLAFVLHGRWLFQQTDQGRIRRAEVLKGLTVSTLVNGTGLRRKRGVWAGQEAPFCILFARNRRPVAGEHFRYLSPVEDDALNERGRLRLDASAMHPVSPAEAVEKPWIFKTLFRGGPLDLGVVEKVRTASGDTTLDAWWPEDFSGRGYQVASDGGGRPALNMQQCLLLEHDEDVRVVLRTQKRPKFSRPGVQFPVFTHWQKHHPEEVAAGLAPRQFRGPLLVVQQVPRAPDGQGTGLAWWSSQDTAYSQSFLGLSAAWHSDPQRLSHYLLVCLNSAVLRHWLLMHGSDWGVERGTLRVDDLRSFPIPAWESVPAALRAEFDACGASMIAHDRVEVDRCDQLVARLYGLTPADLECVRDTLAMAAPGKKFAVAAQKAPSRAARESFRGRLEEILAPLLSYAGRTLRVRVETADGGIPWHLLTVSTRVDDVPSPSSVLDQALEVGSTEGASRVVVAGGPEAQTVVVGVFRQARYWTLTQARALALHLLGDADVMATLRGPTP